MKRRELELVAQENLERTFFEGDLIKNFAVLLADYKSKVNIHDWSVHESKSAITFFILDFDDVLAELNFAVRVTIDNCLKVFVCVGLDMVSSSNMKWLFF